MILDFRYYGYVSNICKVGAGRFTLLTYFFGKMAIFYVAPTGASAPRMPEVRLACPLRACLCSGLQCLQRNRIITHEQPQLNDSPLAEL